MAPTDDADAKALTSSLRLRILRICLYEPRTNKQIAQILDRNPGTTLHHVRTLVAAGFLEPEQPRSGTRNSLERPYRATGKSWRLRGPKPAGTSHLLLQTFLEEIEDLPAEALRSTRLALKLDAEGHREFEDRLQALLDEFAARSPDPKGQPWSIYIGSHPDVSNQDHA